MTRARWGIFGRERVFSRSFWVIFIGKLVLRASFHYGEYRTGNCTQRTWVGSLQAVTSADRIHLRESSCCIRITHQELPLSNITSTESLEKKQFLSGNNEAFRIFPFPASGNTASSLPLRERTLFGTKVKSGSLAPFSGSFRLSFRGGKVVKFRKPFPVACFITSVCDSSQSICSPDDLRSSFILNSLFIAGLYHLLPGLLEQHCNWFSWFQPLSSYIWHSLSHQNGLWEMQWLSCPVYTPAHSIAPYCQ